VASSSAEQVVAVLASIAAVTAAAANRSYPLAFAATAAIATIDDSGCSLLSFDHRCCTPGCTACCYACCNVGFHRGLDSFLSKSFRDHHVDLHVLGARISSHHACSGFHHSDSYPDYDPYMDHRAYRVDQSSIEVYFAFCNIEIRLFID
jgi:hypothetical protein